MRAAVASNHSSIVLHLCEHMEYPTAWTIWFESAGFEFWHGDVWRWNEFFKAWGCERRCRGDATGRHLPRCGRQSVRHGGYLFEGLSETILGKAIAGRRDKVLISTKATFRMGPGPNDLGSSRHHLIQACEGELAAAGHRLHRYLSPARLRRVDADRGSAEHARQSGDERQGALHRLLEFLGMAFDEVAGRFGSIRLGALCGASGVLLADRPRVRMGTDAAGARSGGRRAGVESAGMGTVDGQDPARAATAGGEPAAQDRRHGPQVSDEHLYKVVDALDEVAKETGKTVPQVALNWLLQRPTVSTSIIGARNEEQLRQNLGAAGWNLTAEQVAKLDRGERRDADLSVLASAAVHGAESVAGCANRAVRRLAAVSCGLEVAAETPPLTAAGTAALRLADLLSYRFGLREQVQVVGAAGLGICARHVEAAEGVRADHRSGAFAVDVQVADVELVDGAVDLVAGLGVDRAGQAELGVVGDLEGVVEAASFDHGQHGAEDLFLLELRLRRDVGEDRGLDEIAFAGSALAAGEEASVFLALLDVFEDRLHRAFVDDRAHVGVLGEVADLNLLDAGFELFEELVVDALVDDGARAGGALLSLESECGLRHAFDGGVDVGIGVDDDGVFAAHLEDRALDPDLAGGLRGGRSC